MIHEYFDRTKEVRETVGHGDDGDIIYIRCSWNSPQMLGKVT